jgi:hypothetical protein
LACNGVVDMESSRNNAIFSNGIIDPEEVIDAIKLLSWRWGLSRHKIPRAFFMNDDGILDFVCVDRLL